MNTYKVTKDDNPNSNSTSKKGTPNIACPVPVYMAATPSPEPYILLNDFVGLFVVNSAFHYWREGRKLSEGRRVGGAGLISEFS